MRLRSDRSLRLLAEWPESPSHAGRARIETNSRRTSLRPCRKKEMIELKRYPHSARCDQCDREIEPGCGWWHLATESIGCSPSCAIDAASEVMRRVAVEELQHQRKTQRECEGR